MVSEGERELWRVGDFSCVIISCCAGAELQIRRRDLGGDVVLRELYPTKSDLYERARGLEAQYRL
jgi:hypothetical protein